MSGVGDVLFDSPDEGLVRSHDIKSLPEHFSMSFKVMAHFCDSVNLVPVLGEIGQCSRIVSLRLLEDVIEDGIVLCGLEK